MVEDADWLVVLEGNTRATAYVKALTTSFSALVGSSPTMYQWKFIWIPIVSCRASVSQSPSRATRPGASPPTSLSCPSCCGRADPNCAQHQREPFRNRSPVMLYFSWIERAASRASSDQRPAP